MAGPITVIKKVSVLGDPGVGKTSLIQRYVYNEFHEDYLPTIGTKVSKKVVEVAMANKPQKISLGLMIWDLLGQKQFMRFHRAYLQGTEGGILVCDGLRPETGKALEQWGQLLDEIEPRPSLVVIVNKADLGAPLDETMAHVERLAKRYNTQTILTSAKNGKGVEQGFAALGQRMVDAWPY